MSLYVLRFVYLLLFNFFKEIMCVLLKHREWYLCFAQTLNKLINVDIKFFINNFNILLKISFDFNALFDLLLLIV
jgi:hypothetical protein